jgi:tRNA(Ile)-lysidine synthase
MSSLVERAAQQLDRLAPPRTTVLLAVSGGPDSLAMLDLLARGAALHRRELVVAHVDHGIDARSSEVAGQVRQAADTRSLRCISLALDLGPGTSETRARAARRSALRAMAAEVGASSIVLAHHREDQAETVLLRVLAGSGPAGLAGMARRRGIWLRPLLDFDQAELHHHLEAVGLSAWQDPANRDPRHLRSWLRTVALPLLEQRLGNRTEALNRLAAQAGRDRAAWNQVPELLTELDLRRESGAISVAAPPLLGYRSVVQDAVLSALARRFGVTLGERRREAIRQILSGGRSGARVALGPSLEAELTFDRLILRRPTEVIAGVPLPRGGAVRIGRGQFTIAAGVGSENQVRTSHRAQLLPVDHTVRSWRPGDRIRPLGGSGSRSVAELFKEARVPAGERRGWPVIVLAEDDATVVWVPGICRSATHVPMAGKEALDVECDFA